MFPRVRLNVSIPGHPPGHSSRGLKNSGLDRHRVFNPHAMVGSREPFSNTDSQAPIHHVWFPSRVHSYCTCCTLCTYLLDLAVQYFFLRHFGNRCSFVQSAWQREREASITLGNSGCNEPRETIRSSTPSSTIGEIRAPMLVTDSHSAGHVRVLHGVPVTKVEHR